MLPLLLVLRTVAELETALASAEPGADLVLAAGEYRVNIVLHRSGTADRPIHLHAAPGARVVLSARNPTLRVIEFEKASHWRLSGLALRGSSHANVRITGGTDNTLSDCEIFDAGKKGVIANGDHILLERLYIHDIAQPIGGDDTQGIATWGATHLTIRDSLITTPGDGILIGGAGAASSTSREVRIVGNHFHADDDWYGRWHTENGIDVKNVDGLVVADNVLHHYRGRADDDPMGCAMNLVTRDPEVHGKIERVRIERNIFADLVRGLCIDAADGPGRDLIIRGNLFASARADHGIARKPPGAIWIGRWDGVRIDHNFFVAIDRAAVFVYDEVRDLRYAANRDFMAPGLVFDEPILRARAHRDHPTD